MYCVKCKKATDTSNMQFAVSENKRNMKRGTCVVCGTTKTHLPGHNFTGPGTKLKKRINSEEVE